MKRLAGYSGGERENRCQLTPRVAFPAVAVALDGGLGTNGTLAMGVDDACHLCSETTKRKRREAVIPRRA